MHDILVEAVQSWGCTDSVIQTNGFRSKERLASSSSSSMSSATSQGAATTTTATPTTTPSRSIDGIDQGGATVTETSETDNSNNNIHIDRLVDQLTCDAQRLQDLTCPESLNDATLERLSCFLRDNGTTVHIQHLRIANSALTAASGSALVSAIRAQTSTLLTLDLSNNVALFSTKVNKRDMARSLSSISVSSASSGMSFSVLHDLVDALCLETCRLSELNLSKNDFGTTQKYGAMACLGSLLKYNRSITHLSLAHNSLGPRSIHTLVDGLVETTCSPLQRLDVSYNKLGDNGMKHLVLAMGNRNNGSNQHHTNSLLHIDLSYNKLGPKGAACLAEPLIQLENKTLQSLDLSLNAIGAPGAQTFGWVLRYNHSLVALNLSRNSIGDDGVAALAEGLREAVTPQLRQLDVSWNSLTDQGAQHIAAALQRNAVLETLNVSSNAIGTVGINAIVKALYSDLALVELDIVGNQMRDATCLVQYITHDSYKLRRLAYEKNKLTAEQESSVHYAFLFRENKATWLGKLAQEIAQQSMIRIQLQQKQRDFGDDELIYLSRLLARPYATTAAVAAPVLHHHHHRGQRTKVVSTAFLSSHRVTDRGVAALAHSVLGNRSAIPIQRLYGHGFQLNNNNSSSGVAAVAQALQQSECSLVCLTLSNCHLNATGGTLLADALEHNTSLTRVDLESNQLGDVGVKALLAAVLDPPHPKLVAFNLNNTGVTDAALDRLGRLVRLAELQLDGNDITDRGALDIAKAGMDSQSLRRISLNRNRLSPMGIQTIHGYVTNSVFVLESRDQRAIDDVSFYNAIV